MSFSGSPSSGKKIRIQGGTREDANLCATCYRGQIIKGSADSEEMSYCHHLGHNVPFKIVECSAYDDKRLPDLSTMKSVAWILDSGDKGKGRQIGFLSASEWKKKTGQYADPLENTPY